MGTSVEVPEPVYQRIRDEAGEKDVAYGVVVRDWMEAADRLAEVEGDDGN